MWMQPLFVVSMMSGSNWFTFDEQQATSTNSGITNEEKQ